MDENGDKMLSLEKANKLVWKAVDELEEAINCVDGTPGKKDETRRAELASTLMSFLARQYAITPPVNEKES